VGLGVAQLSKELAINPKTVAKWRKRVTVEDMKTGLTESRSTVLTKVEEAAIIASGATPCCRSTPAFMPATAYPAHSAVSAASLSAAAWDFAVAECRGRHTKAKNDFQGIC